MDRVAEVAVARIEEELRAPDVHVRTARPLRAVALRALARERLAPPLGVAMRSCLVERRPRRRRPRLQERDHRFDFAPPERPAVDARPGRHRRPRPPIGDRRAQKVVAHRGEKLRVGERRRFVRLVPLAVTPVADGAHLIVDLPAALLDRRASDDRGAPDEARRDARDDDEGELEGFGASHLGRARA